MQRPGAMRLLEVLVPALDLSPIPQRFTSTQYKRKKMAFIDVVWTSKDLRQETILLTLQSLVNMLLNEKSGTGI